MAYRCVLCDKITYSIADFREHAANHIMQSKDDTRKEAATFSNDIINSREMVDIEGCCFEVYIRAKDEDFYCKCCGDSFKHWLLAKEHALRHTRGQTGAKGPSFPNVE